jgi:hypothetical protein
MNSSVCGKLGASLIDLTTTASAKSLEAVSYVGGYRYHYNTRFYYIVHPWSNTAFSVPIAQRLEVLQLAIQVDISRYAGIVRKSAEYRRWRVNSDFGYAGVDFRARGALNCSGARAER